MSRSGYHDADDCEEIARYNLWRGTVQQAIRGRRGQRLLRDLIAALDAMPQKRLITDELITPDGECCALGAVALRRGIDCSGLEPDHSTRVARAFDIADALAREIAYVNDEAAGWYSPEETPEARWLRVRRWAESNLKRQPATTE